MRGSGGMDPRIMDIKRESGVGSGGKEESEEGREVSEKRYLSIVLYFLSGQKP